MELLVQIGHEPARAIELGASTAIAATAPSERIERASEDVKRWLSMSGSVAPPRRLRRRYATAGAACGGRFSLATLLVSSTDTSLLTPGVSIVTP